ncbi:MAG: glucosaminidase domain-containing protein [Bacteroidales bacterium]|nr:glucosaminidase domain-containing protein [Bacteroidales bacterium]
MKKILLLQVLLLGIGLCQAGIRLKPYEDYIHQYATDAMIQQVKYGIPSSITLAQGLLESNAGNSELARNSNNHFGIKCHNNWEGPSYSSWDDGEMSCFRKYKSVLDSYTDHSLFLVTRQRYDFLFQLDVKDYRAWAFGLRQAGYATDKQYAQKLIKIIEDYDLDYYDRAAGNHKKARKLIEEWEHLQNEELQDDVYVVNDYASRQEAETSPAPTAPAKERKARTRSTRQRRSIDRPAPLKRNEVARKAKDYSYLAATQEGETEHITATLNHTILYRGSVPYIVAQYGDNYNNLADEFDLSPAKLRKINNLPKQYQIRIGDILYLNKKGKTWEGDEETHIVREDDSMHSISQRYAIDMNELYRLNGMKTGDPIHIGQSLKLR